MPDRKRRARRNRHFRIDDELKPADREAYLAYLREPRTTNKSAHAWLVARGYATFSESAVARHKRHFLERRAEDQHALERARHWAAVARETTSGGGVVEGMLGLSEIMACRRLFDLDPEQPVSNEDLEFFGDVVSRLVDARTRLEKMKLAGKAARANPAAKRPSSFASTGAPPDANLSPEQLEEADHKRMCEVLKQPYLTPEQRAEAKRKWQEFEQRRAAGGTLDGGDGSAGNN